MTFLRHKKPNSLKYSAMAISSAALLMLAVIFLRLDGAEAFVFKIFSKANFFRALSAGQNSQEALLLRAKISDLEKENLELRGMSGVSDGQSEIPATILLGGGYLFSDLLFIDKGSDAGISAGDFALTEEKIFAGKITETAGSWSKIEPIGALGSKTVFRLGANKEISVEGTGLGRGELVAELPREIEIFAGEPVWLGDGPEIAAGLISEVSRVEGRDIQNIYIKSPLPFGSLLNIVILKKQ